MPWDEDGWFLEFGAIGIFCKPFATWQRKRYMVNGNRGGFGWGLGLRHGLV